MTENVKQIYSICMNDSRGVNGVGKIDCRENNLQETGFRIYYKDSDMPIDLFDEEAEEELGFPLKEIYEAAK